MDAATCSACAQGQIPTPYCPYCGAKQNLRQPTPSYVVQEDAAHAWGHFADTIMREYPPNRIGPRRKARREIALALARHHAARGAGDGLGSVKQSVDEVREKTAQFRDIMARADRQFIPFCGNFFADGGWENPTDYGTAKAAIKVSDQVEEYGSD